MRIPTLLCLLLLSVGCSNMKPAELGTSHGAIVGAVTGATLGNQYDNPLGGAIVGATGGAIAGNLIGQTMENRQTAYEQKFRADQQLSRERIKRRIQNAITIEDVIKLAAADVSDDVIINEIEVKGIAFPLTTDQIIHLSDENVSSNVIKAYQAAVVNSDRTTGSPQATSFESNPASGMREQPTVPYYNDSNIMRRRTGIYFGIGN